MGGNRWRLLFYSIWYPRHMWAAIVLVALGALCGSAPIFILGLVTIPLGGYHLIFFDPNLSKNIQDIQEEGHPCLFGFFMCVSLPLCVVFTILELEMLLNRPAGRRWIDAVTISCASWLAWEQIRVLIVGRRAQKERNARRKEMRGNGDAGFLE